MNKYLVRNFKWRENLSLQTGPEGPEGGLPFLPEGGFGRSPEGGFMVIQVEEHVHFRQPAG